MTKYVTKFSDSLWEDILVDEGAGDNCAASVLSRYKPYEPEMALQQFGSKFRQWQTNTVSGGARRFRVPVPDQPAQPTEVLNYMACEWKGDDMSLLDYLRKSTDQGKIVHWLQKKWEREVLDLAFSACTAYGASWMAPETFDKKARAIRKADDTPLWEAALQIGGVPLQVLADHNIKPPSLEEFVRNYRCRGEKIVAADVLHRMSDRYNGQWLMLHVPFKHPHDFLVADVDRLVPEEHRYLAMAMLCKHPVAKAFWGNPAAIEEEMKTEGWRPKSRTSIVNQLTAQRGLVQDYLNGSVKKTAVSAAAAERPRRPAWDMPIKYKYAEMIEAGSKTVEGRLNMGAAARVQLGDRLKLNYVRVVVEEIRYYASFRQLLHHEGYQSCVPDVDSIGEALEVYHGFNNYEELAAEHGVVAFVVRPTSGEEDEAQEAQDATARPKNPHWLQLRFENALNADVDRAFAVRDAKDHIERTSAMEACQQENKIQVCEGPPGSGKTTFLFLVIDRVLQLDGRVLFCTPTAQLASRMREKYGNRIDIDTCHAALGFGRPVNESAYAMAPYTLVCIDEISQISAEDFDHVLQLHGMNDKTNALALLGDRWQMGGMSGSTPWDHQRFKKACFVTKLKEAYRCEDPAYWKLLKGIRTTMPTQTRTSCGSVSVPDLMKGRRAWHGHAPRVEDLAYWLDEACPDTDGKEVTLLAVSRAGVQELNDLAVQALYGDAEPLTWLPGDVESNPNNYDENGNLKESHELVPLEVPIYRGMNIYLTANVMKHIDFVNGMQCVVEAWDAETGGLRVLTKTGYRVVVWNWTSPYRDNLTYYPIRPGYASTVLKFQGATLDFVVLWLNASQPGAAYTAMSRVRRGAHCKIGGNVNKEHFKPAHTL